MVPIYTPYSAMALNSELQMTGYNAFWYNIPWAVRGFGPEGVATFAAAAGASLAAAASIVRPGDVGQ